MMLGPEDHAFQESGLCWTEVAPIRFMNRNGALLHYPMNPHVWCELRWKNKEPEPWAALTRRISSVTMR